MDEFAVDTVEFRRALGAFVTGVTVVTTLQPDGTPRGFTANSFTSVSLDPPLVLVCVAKSASSCAVFANAAHFAVSVLAEDQESVSSLFASKSPDKFAQTHWHPRRTGSPVIRGAAASFDCRMHQVVDAGDHVVLIGRVLDFSHTDATPLGYCRGAYVNFSLAQNALAASNRPANVGAILEHPRGLVLIDTPDGPRLPTGDCLPPALNVASLRGVLAQYGLNAHLDFLFAVFEPRDEACVGAQIYYRGRVLDDAQPHAPVRIVPLAAIPWNELRDDAVVSMLERYVIERSEDIFSASSGTPEPPRAAS